MRSFFFVLILPLAFSSIVAARDFADEKTLAESFQYLKNAKEIAICDTDYFYDGGSLSFTFSTEDGKKTIFVLSTERQRKDQKKFLSVYQNQRIWLVPDTGYDLLASLLRQKLAGGLANDLQMKWPSYKEDAEALCQLLVIGGHTKDLDGFYERSIKRPKKGKEPNKASEPTAIIPPPAATIPAPLAHL